MYKIKAIPFKSITGPSLYWLQLKQ